MTPSPKEKAKELVEKFCTRADELREGTTYNYDKECALIAVVELINSHPQSPMTFEGSYKYWEQVKAEIEKL